MGVGWSRAPSLLGGAAGLSGGVVPLLHGEKSGAAIRVWSGPDAAPTDQVVLCLDESFEGMDALPVCARFVLF